MLSRVRNWFKKAPTTNPVGVAQTNTIEVHHTPNLEASAALYLAASKNDSDTVRLLASSANVNAHTDDNGETALHVAARRGSDDAIRALLGCHKLNPNEVDAHGRTALHTAILYNQKISITLLKNSVDQTITDNSGQTPYDLANYMMLAHLLEYEYESETTSVDEESYSDSKSEESFLQFKMDPDIPQSHSL